MLGEGGGVALHARNRDGVCVGRGEGGNTAKLCLSLFSPAFFSSIYKSINVHSYVLAYCSVFKSLKNVFV